MNRYIDEYGMKHLANKTKPKTPEEIYKEQQIRQKNLYSSSINGGLKQENYNMNVAYRK